MINDYYLCIHFLFQNFLPIMAQEYKFQYELVEYKWPRWLHQQTEKQRTIWGYKILFLDVLFPLDVKKIIFVDADQVVRADMKELVDLDLGGAPYAYTPFCESRKEMDGFRLVLSKNNILFYFKMYLFKDFGNKATGKLIYRVVVIISVHCM